MFDLNRLCAHLKLDPLAAGLQIVDARELAREFFPRLDTDRPALIPKLASAQLARAVRQTLRVNYPATHGATLVNGTRVLTRTLATLTRAVKFNRATVLYLPPLAQASSPPSVAALVARLRAPGGCPWDREQTHTSLRRALLEETYEVIEALDENDPTKLQEELGDLLLHVVFQTQIARDQNEFALADVGAGLAAKLIRRHPHVFGEVKVSGAGEVLRNWEAIKQQEKANRRGVSAQRREVSPNRHYDADIPRDLPALMRAQKVYQRAKREGIALNGLGEAEALVQKIARGRNRERALGETLLALARVAEENGLDAEHALRQATARFVKNA